MNAYYTITTLKELQTYMVCVLFSNLQQFLRHYLKADCGITYKNRIAFEKLLECQCDWDDLFTHSSSYIGVSSAPLQFEYLWKLLSIDFNFKRIRFLFYFKSFTIFIHFSWVIIFNVFFHHQHTYRSGGVQSAQNLDAFSQIAFFLLFWLETW